MISFGMGLLVALLALVAFGSAGYLKSRRPTGKNRSVVVTVFAYGMLSTSVALIPLSVLHFHLGEHSAVHIHEAAEAFGAIMAECGLPIVCAVYDLLVITFGVLFFAFILNQAATRLLMRRFRNREDRDLSKRLRNDFGVEGKTSLLAVRDNNPDAFSFALLERGRYLLPHGRDVIVVTTGLLELLNEEELKTVVAHELAHIRKKDNRYLPFVRALSALVFFDPLIRLIKSRLTLGQEFSADREAAISTGNPIGLARALGKVLLSGRRQGAVFVNVGFFGGSKRKVILERIERLISLAEEMGHLPSQRNSPSPLNVRTRPIVRSGCYQT
jgi:Zn-dependent protease with chaperone function